MPAPLLPRERITRNVRIDELSGCWVWQGATGGESYGRITVNYKKNLAHRQAYADFICEIPKGLHIDHLCGNTLCCNPNHLEAVTQQENNRRAGAMGRMDRRSQLTHCRAGHEYTTENTHVTKQGWRECRACKRESMRRIRLARRTSNPAPSLTIRAK